MTNIYTDKRIVLTLDAGGTSFTFSALQSGKEIVEAIVLDSNAADLDKCLQTLISGFELVKEAIYPQEASAISFAFPGPADYKNGIIGDLPNFPCFRGGVALGPMLEEHFGLPTIINNDGNLFAYGEAVAGFLAHLNSELSKNGVEKQYKNLIGLTLGTGFGAGVVLNNEICDGDNSVGGEIWLSKNALYPDLIAEESVSIRGIQRVYANLSEDSTHYSPEDIANIATGKKKGDRVAALKAFEEMSIVIAEALSTAVNMLDSAVVIGGGISGAAPLIVPYICKHLNNRLNDGYGNSYSRTVSSLCYVHDETSLKDFLLVKGKEIQIPYSTKKVLYNESKKIPIGISKLGTSKAICFGAYALAIAALDTKALIDMKKK